MKGREQSPAVKVAVCLFWLLLWALAARLVGRELLLPSPLQVLRRLYELARGRDYWIMIANSLLRVLTGIVAATLLGVLLAMLTEYSAFARALLSPIMTLVKSTPVASFIILALVWLGRSVLPAFISGLMVLPVVWANVSAGIAAEVLTVPRSSIGRMIYESKLYLETTSLFAWTLTVILLSLVIERLLLRLVRQIGRKGGGADV